uniref:THAP-type domain-containing protein n=1 Tax=Xiphophorus couchianus TaxID=32473 RepID=A0A3B5M9B2_9TELE
MKRTQKRKHFRATGSTAEFCCVPFCPMTSSCNRGLSFFHFPSNFELRQQWIVAIRRKNLVINAHTRVCSQHFKLQDIKESWNNYSLPCPKPRILEKVAMNVLKEHNYATVPEPAVADVVLENNILRKKIQKTQEQIGSLIYTLSKENSVYCYLFCWGFFFFRFASYDHLMRFWALIEPFLPTMISVPQNIDATPSTHSLQPIDEFFLFLNYLARGSKQQDLADQYGVHQSTIIRIITTWSNFLFMVLGSIRIWIPQDQIHKNLPAVFEDCPDTTVIIDSIELRCQCPSSPLLQSEVSSFYKSRCTLKGLIGIAPHGPVTFISRLHTGSISDEKITRESGLLALLKPGMAVMVDRGFPLTTSYPMSAGEVRKTKAIARLRVHVECLVRRVKERKLFDSEIPLGFFGIVNQLYTVAYFICKGKKTHILDFHCEIIKRSH